MMNFEFYIMEAGGRRSYPPIKWKWAAYKQGSAYIFDTKEDAAKVSTNIEQVQDKDSLKQFREVKQHNAGVETLAYQLWYADLRNDYNHLSDEVFNLIHYESYERYHSEGWDAVASGVEGLVGFALAIIKASQTK